MSVKIINNATSAIERLAKQLDELAQHNVFVGIPASENTVVGDTNQATIAANLEYGNARKKIPARPFLRQTLSENQSAYLEMYKSAIDNGTPPKQAVELVAKKSQSDVQLNIRNGDWAPNSATTIKRKGSSRPLIDTGRLRQSIRGIVVKK